MNTAFLKALELIFSGSNTVANILSVTLKMSFASSLISLALGVPFGVLLGCTHFPGKRAIVVFNRTLIGLPPVVCGLLCFMLFCGVGPLRHLKLLYTIKGMVIAQIILITPLVTGFIEPYVNGIYPDLRETSIGMGLSKGKLVGLIINESWYQILSTYMLAFARAIAEVGAVSMVGGAIIFKTNVMTTAIMNYTNMGDFVMALALGIILFALALILNTIVGFMQVKSEK